MSTAEDNSQRYKKELKIYKQLFDEISDSTRKQIVLSAANDADNDDQNNGDCQGVGLNIPIHNFNKV